MLIIEKTLFSTTAPKTIDVLWCDISNPTSPVIKAYVNGEWRKLSDETGDISRLEEAVRQVVESLGNKVDKVEGMGLSHNDFTAALLEKLNGIEAGAQKNTVTSVAGRTGAVTLTKIDVGLDNVTNDAQVKRSEMGAANGVATLDENGRLRVDQIPELYDVLSYGIEWDITVSNPACTRVGNPLLHKSLPIQSAMRGCVALGQVINYYLDANDWSLKEDGTASVLDGTDGYVRVHTPKFYIRSFIIGNKRQVRISTIKIDPTWIEVPEALVDAYRPTLDRTNSASIKAVSVINTSSYFRGGGNRSAYDAYLETDPIRSDLGKPVTALTRATMRTYARNAGSELLCYEYYKYILYWLFVIEYSTFNSQAPVNNNLTSEGYHQGGLGNGMSTWNSTEWSQFNGYYPITPCGATNSLGNFSGEVAITTEPWSYVSGETTVEVPSRTYYANRYRGIENPFGDVWTNLDGIIIDANCGDAGRGDNLDIVYVTDDPNAFGETITDAFWVAGHALHQDGYIGEFDLGERAEIIPSAMNGGATSKKCDYRYSGEKNSSLRTLLVGGLANYGALAGLAYFASDYGVGSSYAIVGFRTITTLN